MNFARLIYVIHSFVSVYGGAILIAGPAKLRWNNRIAKGILFLLMTAIAILSAGNVFWAKFSSGLYMIVTISSFIVLIIFLRINFWQLFDELFLYWYSVKLALDLMICICCFMEDIAFYQYVNERFHVSWHWLHLSGMMLMDALIVFLVYIMWGKSLILCRRKRSYIFLALFVIMEMIMDQYLFSNELVSGTISRTYIVFAVLIMMLFLCGGIIAWIIKTYTDACYKQQIVNTQFLMTQEQYRILKELYNQKRKQIHDTVQQDILLRGYLREGASDKALDYLDYKLETYGQQKINCYVGIPVIDIMLDYKINQAASEDISIQVHSDVFECFLEENDICILLGNLMDNAIEAVRPLEKARRHIKIDMQTPNGMFAFTIGNPYEGKRKRRGGRYVSTKKDKMSHGIGLTSVEDIVNKYKGIIEISDDHHYFEVSIMFFNYRK